MKPERMLFRALNMSMTILLTLNLKEIFDKILFNLILEIKKLNQTFSIVIYGDGNTAKKIIFELSKSFNNC